MELVYQFYRCPVCKQGLQKIAQNYSCEQKHSYDISREGYVNLVLANQKKTKNPGDSKFMVESRKYFLEQGYYNPLSDMIDGFIVQWVTKSAIASNKYFAILDAGCGEGFYSEELKKSLEKKKKLKQIRIWGIDISKEAICKAAKRDSSLEFCIGSTFALPYLNESFDVIFSIFSPLDFSELLRVLKPGGKIICIRPGPQHLQEVAKLIYDKAQLQGKPLESSDNSSIPLIEKKQLTYKIRMKKDEDLMNLITMTPYYWHMNKEKEALLSKKKDLSITVDFQITLFQK